ncbi:hypothetical protein KJ951_00080 [Patescibacteria group bacterium]|nr:hypothetical protein [Patescibacteria group bacterium]MBU1702791.1 hypothetical protein [Patescibacteria group bacterium]MBU1953816.1 hypothetical protein [Patescibacteria group bacterium]
MFFRRVLAAIMIFVFVSVSTVAFLIFAVGNTFFRASFYEKDIKEAGYEFLVDAAVASISQQDTLISKYFIKEELKDEVEKVFPISLFEKSLNELVQEVQSLKDDPNRPLTFRLGMFRESLLTLANNLSYKIFESLPFCAPDEVPNETVDGLPSCVPQGFAYNDVSGELSAQFEEDVYSAVPEQVQFDVNSALGADGPAISQIFTMVDTVKMVFYVILLVLLGLIALVIYRPFSAILMAEGIAFSLSGAVALIVGYVVGFMPALFNAGMKDNYLKDVIYTFMVQVAGIFGGEVQRGGMVFLATGIILLAVRFFLRRR